MFMILNIWNILKFIKRWLLNLTNRKSEANVRIENYFRLNEGDKMYHKIQMTEDKLSSRDK